MGLRTGHVTAAPTSSWHESWTVLHHCQAAAGSAASACPASDTSFTAAASPAWYCCTPSTPAHIATRAVAHVLAGKTRHTHSLHSSCIVTHQTTLHAELLAQQPVVCEHGGDSLLSGAQTSPPQGAPPHIPRTLHQPTRTHATPTGSRGAAASGACHGQHTRTAAASWPGRSITSTHTKGQAGRVSERSTAVRLAAYRYA